MQQLSVVEHALWRRLSVFAGDFSREALEAVGAGEGITQEQAAHILNQLIAQGVVAVEAHDQETRYRLPEPQRRTGHAQLIDCGEADAVYRCLHSFYATLAEQVLQEAFGPQRATWMRRLEREHVNLRATLNWLVAHGDAEHGLHLAYLLQELWFEETYTSEGRAWFATLLALPHADVSTTLRAQSLDLAGALALNQDDYATARALKEEGLAILRASGDTTRLGYALLHLGHLVGYAQGDLAAAQALYQEGLGLFRALSHAEGTAHALANVGNVAIMRGDYATASPLVAESLRIYQALGFVYDMALSLGRVAGIAAGTNHPERALRLAGASAAHCASVGVSQPHIFQERSERMIERARQALNETTQAARWAEGQAMPLAQAVTYALDEPA
jgi:tetratricopeptide (TPR) repeat protein